MNGHRDPVDSALEILRSEGWTAPDFKPETENALMQKFESHQKMRRFIRGPVAVAAIGVLAVGSVAFAATGAAQRLRQWFLNIDLGNGETARLVVQDGQPGEVRIDNPDGSTTTVNAVAEVADDGEGHKARVTVVRAAPGAEDEQVVVSQMRRQAGSPEHVDLSVLDGAALIGAFRDEQTKRIVEVFSTAAEKGGMQAYVVTEGVGIEPQRHILASPLLSRLQPGTPATVTLSDAGMIEINFDAGPGERAAIRLSTSSAAMDDAKEMNVTVDEKGGTIQVRVPRPADAPK